MIRVMKYHSLKIAEKIWFSLTVNYDINKCFSSYEMKQKLKMFPQACNILKCCREISPMKMRVFIKRNCLKIPICHVRLSADKIWSKNNHRMTDGSVSKCDISVENNNLNEWQTGSITHEMGTSKPSQIPWRKPRQVYSTTVKIKSVKKRTFSKIYTESE